VVCPRSITVYGHCFGIPTSMRVRFGLSVFRLFLFDFVLFFFDVLSCTQFLTYIGEIESMVMAPFGSIGRFVCCIVYFSYACIVFVPI
jgi:hypothetical protein